MRRLLNALTKMVPTKDPSGMNPKEPLPSMAREFNRLLSRLLPNPNVEIEQVTSGFSSLYFYSDGMCPRGGTMLGCPSVNRSIYLIELRCSVCDLTSSEETYDVEVARSSLKTSRLTLIPSQILVEFSGINLSIYVSVSCLPSSVI